MKILILGGGGMLGHQVSRRLQAGNEVWVTFRKATPNYGPLAPSKSMRVLPGIDATDFQSLAVVVRKINPDVIINCIGVIKQVKEAQDPIATLTINSLLPHRLALAAASVGSRLMHVSTDCVFSGRKGNYTESDVPDPEDIYGRTKLLGEVIGPNCVTLRTSIIGRELGSHFGLIEWFLNHQGEQINGYRRAIYTGLTTLTLALVIEDILLRHETLSGLWHVSSDPISKYDLLLMAAKYFNWRGTIVPDDSIVCDRSLNSSRFRNETGFIPPTWEMMLTELARNC